ncbi:MAG: hypothetical protein Q8L22_22555 [Reyranella sp.]|nr:hypothetical protein [Reyranella sp.]
MDALSPAASFVVCFGVGSTAISASEAQALEEAAAQAKKMGADPDSKLKLVPMRPKRGRVT